MSKELDEEAKQELHEAIEESYDRLIHDRYARTAFEKGFVSAELTALPMDFFKRKISRATELIEEAKGIDYEEAFRGMAVQVEVQEKGKTPEEAFEDLGIEPTNEMLGFVYHRLGSFYLYNRKKKDLHKAHVCYLKAINLNPNIVDAHVHVAGDFKVRARYERAIFYYKRALELDPARGDVYYSLGLCYKHMKGKREEAKEVLQKAVELGGVTAKLAKRRLDEIAEEPEPKI